MSDLERSGLTVDSLRALVRRDRRYALEAYLFVFEALRYTVQTLEVEGHVTGQQLCHGLRELAIDRFGPLAHCVFRQWGIAETADFGRIVFNLIEINLMGKTDHDDVHDFDDVFDLEAALTDVEMCVSVGA